MNRIIQHLCAIFILLPGITLAAASDGENTLHKQLSPETVIAFAEYLQESGDYYRAITEYKRFLFYWPDHPDAALCRFRIGRSYLLGSDYTRAISVFQELLNESPTGLQSRWIAYDYAAALYGNERYTPAIFLLNEAEQTEPSITIQQSIRYSRTWCHLEQRDILTARSLWPDPDNPIRIALDNLTEGNTKNPQLAGILSAVLPGSGQIYAGRWRDGLVSFLVNGLFIGAITAAINTDHEETAAVLGFFELGFYTANIYNAVNDAHKENRRLWESQLHEFEQQHGPAFRIIYTF